MRVKSGMNCSSHNTSSYREYLRLFHSWIKDYFLPESQKLFCFQVQKKTWGSSRWKETRYFLRSSPSKEGMCIAFLLIPFSIYSHFIFFHMSFFISLYLRRVATFYVASWYLHSVSSIMILHPARTHEFLWDTFLFFLYLTHPYTHHHVVELIINVHISMQLDLFIASEQIT